MANNPQDKNNPREGEIPPGAVMPGQYPELPSSLPPVLDPASTSQSEIAEGITSGGVRPTYGQKFWETSLETYYEQGFEEISRYYDRVWARNEAEAGKQEKLSPEEANKIYGDWLDEPFTSPVYASEAKLVADYAKQRAQRRAWINRGPESGLLFDLAAGAVGSIIDPLNLALGGATGLGVRAAGIAAKTAWGAFGLSLGENFVGNLIGEAPSYLLAQEERQKPRTAGEVLLESGAGALLGTAIFSGAGAVFRRVKGRTDLAASLIENNRSPTPPQPPELPSYPGDLPGPRPGTLYPDRVYPSGTQSPPGVVLGPEGPAYQVPTDLSQTYFYVPIDPEGRPVVRSTIIGKGVAAIDNVHASQAIGGATRRIAITPESNIIDGDAKLASLPGANSAQLRRSLYELLSDGGKPGVVTKDLEEGINGLFKEGTVADLIAKIHDIRSTSGDPDAIGNIIRGAGYDGVFLRGYDDAGRLSDTRLMIFNLDRIVPTNRLELMGPMGEVEPDKVYTDYTVVPPEIDPNSGVIFADGISRPDILDEAFGGDIDAYMQALRAGDIDPHPADLAAYDASMKSPEASSDYVPPSENVTKKYTSSPRTEVEAKINEDAVKQSQESRADIDKLAKSDPLMQDLVDKADSELATEMEAVGAVEKIIDCLGRGIS